MKRAYRFTVAAVLAVAAMCAVYWQIGIFFETNDDRIITETLSGAINHTPSAYVQVVSYLLSAPLAWLYRIAKEVPWYGLCLILFHVISYTAIFSGFLFRCSKRYEILLGVGLCIFIFSVDLYSIGLIQWTSTAAILAIAGYAYLALEMDDRSVVVFAVLELLGFLLRDKAMLMIQPLGAAVLFGFFLSKGGFREKKQCQMILKWALALASVILVGAMSRWIIYRSEEWKAADKHFDACVTLADYYGMPSYDQVKDILDKYHGTETEYEGFSHWLLVGSNINADCLEELAEYVENSHPVDINVAVLLWDSVEKLIEPSLTCNRVAALLWICTLLWMIFAKRKEMFLPALGLGVARTVVWCYLIYGGRMPNRVTYPLFFAEVVLLLVILLNDYGKAELKIGWYKLAALCLCGIVAYSGFRTAVNQYRYVDTVNGSQSVYMLGYEDIKDYCRQHPDNRYVLDTFSFNSYKGGALESDLSEPWNGIFSGTWIDQTPANKEYEREYMGGGWKNFYVIVYDDGQPTDVQMTNIAVRYFAEKSGVQPYLEDHITVAHGGSYLVWHFEGNGTD